MIESKIRRMTKRGGLADMLEFTSSNMGCCCSKRRDEEDDDVIELSTATNDAVSCKLGKFGSKVKVIQDVTNNRYKVSGIGTAIGSCPLECDSAYWEVVVGDNPEGVFIGVKRFHEKRHGTKVLDGFLDDPVPTPETPTDGNVIIDSWYMKEVSVKKGDVIGIYWDQIDLPMLCFSLNGVPQQNSAITRVRPTANIYPAVSIKEGSTCEITFDGTSFVHVPKSSRYSAIVCATSLI
jgi:hypothetical protein